MTASVTVLGCSGMFATRERASSGYLLEWNGFRVWLDAGAGSWQNLLAHTDYRDLDGVLLTHRHPDHMSDVFQALHARYLGTEQPCPSIPLWAPQETLDVVSCLDTEMWDAFEFRDLSADRSLEINGARLSFVSMAHPPETLGIRFEFGGVFAYSADSGPDADFQALAASSDLFLCEATLEGNKTWEGHLNGGQAGSIAADVGCSRLVLTHLAPEGDRAATLGEARAAAPSVDVALAEQGDRFEI